MELRSRDTSHRHGVRPTPRKRPAVAIGRNRWQNGTSRENGSNQRKPLRGLRPVAADMTGKGAPPLRRKGVASLAPRKPPSPANPEAHSIAWTFFYGESRATFRDRLGLDDGTWA